MEMKAASAIALRHRIDRRSAIWLVRSGGFCYVGPSMSMTPTQLTKKTVKLSLLAALLVGLELAPLGSSAQPVVTHQPQNSTNFAGSTALFTVGAMGTPPLTHQWRSYASPSSFTNIDQPTNFTLALRNVQP